MNNPDWIGRRVRFLLSGIPPLALKVTSIENGAVTGTPDGDDEIHIDLAAIVAWQYGRPESKLKGKKKRTTEE